MPADASAPPNREAVKVLAKAVGIREAARRMGLSEERVMKWSQRDPDGPWGSAVVSIPRQRGPVAVSACPQNVRTAPDAMAESLDSLSKRGRLGYLRAGVAVGEAMARKAEITQEANPDDPDALLAVLMPEGQNAKAWASTTALAGSWEAKTPQANVMISVQMLGVRPAEAVVEGRVIESE